MPRRYRAATPTKQLFRERTASADLHCTGCVVVGYGAGVGDDGGFDGFCDEAEYLSGGAAV